MIRAYYEVVNFIANGTTPHSVASFVPSQATKDRVADLIHKEKSSGLLPEESRELDYVIVVEQLMRLAKARARAICSR